MLDLDRRGVEPVVGEALERVTGAAFVHVSLDMDVVDPEAAPGVGTPVRGGLSYREAHLAMELVAESGLVGSLEVVEVNPILDRENETAKPAVELVASALGARVLALSAVSTAGASSRQSPARATLERPSFPESSRPFASSSREARVARPPTVSTNVQQS